MKSSIMTKIIGIALGLIILLNTTVFATSSSYTNKDIKGTNVKTVTINMNNSNIVTTVLNANGQMVSSNQLSTMAKSVGAFVAINGTYFEAYNGIPVPWGTLIKDGKILHTGGGAVAGITADRRLIIDRITFSFEGYVNGVLRAYPWRLNHLSTEAEAITIFTPEYGTTIVLNNCAKAVRVSKGVVSEIITQNFKLEKDEFAIVYNTAVVNLLDERYKIGDEVYYTVKINPTFTNEDDWNQVITAVGAGPSLIINNTITADGLAEGFFEAKINTNAAHRSFIGATADGKIVIGNMGATTIKQAAEIAKEMKLVNAMCLDGGGSIALYYPEKGVNISGRNINNGLGFIELKGIVAKPTSSKVVLDGEIVEFEGYNINNNNYFKLRDIAKVLTDSKAKFNVIWDNDKKAINLVINEKYESVDGELTSSGVNGSKSAIQTNSPIYLNGEIVKLTAYNINENNYFKLRDLEEVIGFKVDWDSITNSILITTKP